MATRTVKSLWDRFEDRRSAHDELDQLSRMLAFALGLHGQRQAAAAGATTAWAPALDICERKDAYMITVELPATLDDLRVTMEDSPLTIQGERIFAHDSSEHHFHRIERRSGSFRRSITLPAHVVADQIQATIDGGVLEILLSKAEEAKPRHIEIRPGRATVVAATGDGATPR
jgi:HSP20 family protein